jgi:flavodoxin
MDKKQPLKYRKRGTYMKKLVIYYSQANGNTKRIAEMISEKTGADIAVIDTVTPYTGSYEEIVNQAQEEVNHKFKPEIKELNVDLARYDEIIIGTPTWWYTMAPAVLTFLTHANLTGKSVVLFQTHGGWPGYTLKDMKLLCRGATILNEKAIQFDSTGGNHLETPLNEIESWISRL